MKIKELISTREDTVSNITKTKEELVWMENQLNDLPFYAEYIEKKAELAAQEKKLKSQDKDIFSEMTENNLENVRWENFTYLVKTSSRASIKVTDESKLPEEAFTRTVVSKTELWKLIHKAKEAWETFEWAEESFSKSLEII